MIRRTSLRIRITLVATIIMILVSVILTGISIYNAKINFLPAIGQIDINKGDIVNDSEMKLDGSMGMGFEEIEGEENSNVQYEESINYSSLEHAFKNTAILYMIVIIIMGSIIIYFILGKMLKPIKTL